MANEKVLTGAQGPSPVQRARPVWALLGLGAVLSIIALLYVPPPSSSLLKGQLAPDFAFRSEGGANRGPQKLSSLQGRVVLLNFWAYWCAPCLEEMPSLQALEAALSPADFTLLLVHVGDGREFTQSLSLPGQLVFDIPPPVFDAYGVSGLPHSVLLDRQGRIQAEIRGPRDWVSRAMRTQVEALLE